MLGLLEEVQCADEALELLGISGILRDKLRSNVVLVVKLSDLIVLIDHCCGIIIPVHPCQLREQIELRLASTWLRQLRSLSQIEGKCKELLAVT